MHNNTQLDDNQHNGTQHDETFIITFNIKIVSIMTHVINGTIFLILPIVVHSISVLCVFALYVILGGIGPSVFVLSVVLIVNVQSIVALNAVVLRVTVPAQ
jgi:hypothetical protein